LAALKRTTNAAIYIHPVDAEIARTDSGFRPLTPAPGLLTGQMFRLFVRSAGTVDRAMTDYMTELTQ